MIINKNRSFIKKQSANDKFRIPVDVRTLDILCRYVISQSQKLRINNFVKINDYINCIDPQIYINDPDKIKRINFIKSGLDARINYNINDKDLILNHIESNLGEPIDFVDVNREFTTNEIEYVNKMVSETTQYSFVFNGCDEMIDLCTRIKSSDFNTRGPALGEMKELIASMNNMFRKTSINNNLTDMTFSLRNGEFEQAVTDTYNTITNPSRRLMCGMQGLNEMIGGGFESGRVYMFLGITGIGKSLTLLNLMYQLKKYNTNYKTKDPTKIPCIVLLTMENTVVETITRLFDLATELNRPMGSYSVDEVINLLRTEGQLTLCGDSPIDIVIKYKANKSVDTSYMYELCDDLEDDGYEVICFVQDHVKRIRSIFNSQDLRIELGDIVNEMKVFAAYKDIPVITDCHLNRDAARIVEEAQSKTIATDITMKLGKSNVGESLLMMDNIDCAIIINIDYSSEGDKHMVFNLTKMRDKTVRTYMAQPFVRDNPIRLVEDLYGPPQFKDFLHGGNGGKDNRKGSILHQNMSQIDFSKNPFTKFKDRKELLPSEYEPETEDHNKIEEDISIDALDGVPNKNKDVIKPFYKLADRKPPIKPFYKINENEITQESLDSIKDLLKQRQMSNETK